MVTMLDSNTKGDLNQVNNNKILLQLQWSHDYIRCHNFKTLDNVLHDEVVLKLLSVPQCT